MRCHRDSVGGGSDWPGCPWLSLASCPESDPSSGRSGSPLCGLLRFLADYGLTVIEVDRPDRSGRRRNGKSDPLDAESAARAVLFGRASGIPKSRDAQVEMIRVLRVARRGAMKASGATAVTSGVSCASRSSISARPAQAPPWRRPERQQCPVAHRPSPDALPPAHQGLRRPADRRRPDEERDPALPQAIHRPRSLPTADSSLRGAVRSRLNPFAQRSLGRQACRWSASAR